MAVTPANVATNLGLAPPDEDSVLWASWALWIESARFQIRNRLGDLDELDQDTLDYVVLEAVSEHARHPDSAKQVTVSVDDASTSRTYNTSAGRVMILPEWWDMLDASTDDGGAFSVRPSFEPDTAWPCWVSR